MTQINDLSHDNQTATEQMAEISTNLSGSSNGLAALVRRFKTE